MLHPQIVVFERERRIAPHLRELAAAERWALREPRQRENCRNHLRQVVPTVLVIGVDRPSDAALELLQTIRFECPHVAIVAVGSVDDAETLAGLASDLGADYALFPPLSLDLLSDVVRGLMQRSIKKQNPPAFAGGLAKES
jgi:DNA-binding response OmpR family regulator